MSLSKAPLANYAFFRQSFYQVEDPLKILKTEALEAKYIVSNITGERCSTGLSWSDLMLMGFTRRSVDAEEKVGKMEELFSLWRNVDEILVTVEDSVKRYVEALAFVNGGFGTKNEKRKCKKIAKVVLAGAQQVLDSRARAAEAENKVKALACEIGTSFSDVVTVSMEEMQELVHNLS